MRQREEKINAELEKSAEKYHILGAWIAIIFDPLFAITDYLNIPNSSTQLFVIRLTVATITFTVLKLRKELKIKSNTILIFIPFTLISLQNAYTFYLISDEHILGHCLNYIALFIGGGMFILWNWKLSSVTISASAIVSSFFIYLNPDINFNNFLLNGGLLLIAVGAFMFVLIRTRYDLTIKEITARLQVEEINEELIVQKNLVEATNYQITSSIRYAQRIQHAILGDENDLEGYFDKSFTFFKPKDILSGDFYWFYEDKEKDIKVIVAADCTGHGVPGALTTVLGCALLNDIVVQKNVYMPNQILELLDEAVIKSFSSEKTETANISDGMDISILTFKKNKVYFSAAKNPLYVIRNGQVSVIKGSRNSIGRNPFNTEKVFETHVLDLVEGDKYYIFSDGFQDQFGGESNQKYYTKRYREFLISTSNVSMQQQHELLTEEFNNWKGNLPQTDDVLVVGIEV